MNATKLTRTLLTLPMLLVAMWAAHAHAGTASSNLNISALVVENCTISTTALDFGTYDPIIANAANPLLGNGVVTVACTTGTQASVMLEQGEYAKDSNSDGATRPMSDAASNEISYSLYSDPGRTVIWGATEETSVRHIGTGNSSELIVYGSIAPGQNLPEGNFSSTLLATVIF